MTRAPRRPSPSSRPLWVCPTCARPFANRNQSHACETSHVRSLDDHFRGKSPALRALFDAFLAAARESGTVDVVSSKSRIGLQTRMIFAALMPRKNHLRGHLVLARPVKDPRFLRVESLSSRNHVHTFRLDAVDQLDRRFRDYIAEACRVGRQEHLRPRGAS